MASTATIPAFVLPRAIPRAARPPPASASLFRRASAKPCNSRCASTSSQKPRVLEKPDKFRPPSHPARRVLSPNAQPRNYPGPPLSAKELEEQKTKRYPNMFPPEGTVMHKFLTNRGIHLWISLGVLFSLATFTYTTNFRATSPFAHLLPPWSGLLTHPIDTVGQFLSVMKMHADHLTLETTEKRKRNVDDVQKRKEYRIAHGLEEPDVKPESDENSPQRNDADGEAGAVAVAASGTREGGQPGEGETYVDWEGKKRPVKKWFGIW
ncbi:uncharacterized protein CIMG_05095 [Coccidioides immitis RS]|uniref:Uncharacterized protein n=1 Tax=Coccidioides immitis (strain RS) TaxID=246410 RepID=J3KEV8_COCIM|nr:uncharacterized protein CIMG_05095 [Coccidioides immitis RS]EAS34071.3 hypothetical protein CIMG_05095 [Coccidioides immitis RS]